MTSLFLTPKDFERIFTSHLKIETYSKSIDSLFSLRSLKKINYKPYYQRNYVWDDDKATYFIESILLGTEIPPLIFFNNAGNIEVIDGRQRFETIKRFKDNDFSLTRKGLASLKQLAKSNYEFLGKNPETASIIDLFLDAKIRIIEFEIVNEPKLDSIDEDKIKKEIFGRYNSGITPLKKPEIDNAIYDTASTFQSFKKKVTEDVVFCKMIDETFFSKKEITKEFDTGKILQFIRRYLVLHKFPIKYYARGNNRIETLDKLYECLEDQTEGMESINEVCKKFIDKIDLIYQIKQNFIKLNLNYNRLVFECLLWGLQVLDTEQINLSVFNDINIIKRLGVEISANLDKIYKEIELHYYSQVYGRFLFTANLLEKEFNISLRAYVDGDNKKEEIKQIRNSENNDTVTKLAELESLRVTKPEPSRNSIDDIARLMSRNIFLVRPSYQRTEVISVSKASSIIESILLDISLPPIFIYKRKDGISEVIDGQQRLLTILGFIGENYIDENNFQCKTKNSGFALKGLKILEQLNNKTYKDLKPALQDKILDFELFVVEIQESLNPEFNPVDLFVRLNNKPYPIRENSFEMWNSWVDREIIETIRKNVEKHKQWLYIKLIKGRNDRDRMENEELYMSLAYLEFQGMMKNKEYDKDLYIYSKNDGISIRMGSSQDITRLLQNVSEDEQTKIKLLKAIKSVESFISKLKLVLLDRDVEDKKNLLEFFASELNSLFKAERKVLSFRRTKQDFYTLWYLLTPLNYEMVKLHRLEIKNDLQSIFYVFRNESANFTREDVLSRARTFHEKYSVERRQTKISEKDKMEMLKQQGNICPISGAPLFIGDEIEVDHSIPLGIGGADSIDNLQIVHKDSNRRKGAKPTSE